MTRFQRLALATLVTTLALVTIGVIVRATESGLGCPDWPLCHGQLIPAFDDGKAWIEWIHRSVAVVVGFEVLGLAILALRDYRRQRSILWPTIAAVGLVFFQAWLGRETVRLGNSGESVTAHLATAMSLVGLLVYVTVRSGYPARIGGRGTSQRFTLLAAFGAVATFALLLFGSHVTATESALIFPDWPLMGGTLVPPLTEVTSAHVLHRWVAAVVGLVVARDRGRRLADAARPPRPGPAVAVGRRPVPRPGRGRWRPGPDQPRGVDPDPAPRPRRDHLGADGGPHRDGVLRGAGRRRGDTGPGRGPPRRRVDVGRHERPPAE